MSDFINCQYCGKPRPVTVTTCPYCKPTAAQILNNGINKTAGKAGKTLDAIKDRADEIKKNKIKREAAKPTEKICPKCAMVIPAKAAVCPYCRKTISTSPVPLFFVGALIVIIAVAMCSSPPDQKQAGPNRFDIIDSAKAGMDIILKAPSTAKYPGPEQWIISELPDQYKVTSYVDAQNSFGAMIRYQLECSVFKSNMKALCSTK